MTISGIEKGLDVYDINGEKIGTVADTWPQTTATSGTGGGPGSLGDESPVVGSTAPTPDEMAATAPGGVPGVGEPVDVVVEEVEVVATRPESGSAFGTYADTAGSSGYFKVDEGGFLGIGAKELYIPYSAVEDVVPGDRVILNCTKDQADSQFATKPAFLETVS